MERNRLLQQHNRDLISTVQWAIGFAAAVAVAFLGLVGFVTHRRYEQEKELLLSAVEQQGGKVSAELSSEQSAWREATSKELLERDQALTDRLEKRTREIAQETVAKLSKRVANIEYESLHVQRRFEHQEAVEWEKKGVLSNALMSHFEVAKIGRRSGEDWIVSEALGEIRRLLDGDGRFGPEEVRELTAFLDELSPDFRQIVDGIKAKLSG